MGSVDRVLQTVQGKPLDGLGRAVFSVTCSDELI
jgi:hypothetical protein